MLLPFARGARNAEPLPGVDPPPPAIDGRAVVHFRALFDELLDARKNDQAPPAKLAA